jgi:hypothetical protein
MFINQIMKILYITTWMHHKNHHALMNYKNIEFKMINSIHELINPEEYDCVISPSEPIDTSKYPNAKFIFGPHFSVFPDENLLKIQTKNAVYNNLCDWVRNDWQKSPYCSNIKSITMPFGVDTERFKPTKPINERDKIFVYFKNRHPNELYLLEKYLKTKNIEYKMFHYEHRYHEADYMNYLQESKYGIWLGRHESQGFALQEALSANVPLLVWNVKSMNQEYGCNYEDIPATVVPYWDNTCGETFYNYEELETTHNILLQNIGKYNPRKFIEENLCMEVCEQKLIKTIQDI